MLHFQQYPEDVSREVHPARGVQRVGAHERGDVLHRPVCGENALQQPPHRRVCTDTRVRAGEPATTLLPVPAKTNGRRLQELAANTRDSVYIVVTSMYSK